MKINNDYKSSRQAAAILLIDAFVILLYMITFWFSNGVFGLAEESNSPIRVSLYFCAMVFDILAYTSCQLPGLIIDTKIIKRIFEKSEKPNVFLLFFACFHNFILLAVSSIYGSNQHRYLLLTVIIIFVAAKVTGAAFLAKRRSHDRNQELNKNI